MKRFIEGFLAVCILAACVSLFAQTAPARKTPPTPARETPAVKETPKTAGKTIEGFNKTKWGDSLNSVKNNVLGKITYTDEKKIITSRDGDIEYIYGFFARETAPAADTGDTTAAEIEPRLYYVAVRFPYLAMDEVNRRIQDQYGPFTGETLKDNQGARIWDSEKTAVVMWVDRYEKKPYSRKITYVGKELAKDVNKYQEEVFSRAEIEILKRLKP
ncbi:MAG: hypothetical protein EHM32_11410 [Spirochaetales bacterium]|nr:MAG: hypothetical protein EHM32_11410 [Spirochaetales bacterium]